MASLVVTQSVYIAKIPSIGESLDPKIEVILEEISFHPAADETDLKSPVTIMERPDSELSNKE